eukprot:NODE_1709_length_554_cov_763.279208_g1378_i0.p1 GENE.NODE_1709_length_554_cov_763.279208_g1378_i0~~NODE_1709_length_554_cov_763.279208_g1378_i0.p1  ORF type:complete len:147 (-),score=36.87 NODE_1709_length_554_cov_763.279208_g1378_i0:114-524(-)
MGAEAIELEPAPARRAKSVQALKQGCEKDAMVIVAVARLFWADRKLDKTRSWFNRAVALDSDYGDAWAQFYKFEIQHGSDEQKQHVLTRCLEADPHHGEKWVSVSKNVDNCTVGGCSLSCEQILKRVVTMLDSPSL